MVSGAIGAWQWLVRNANVPFQVIGICQDPASPFLACSELVNFSVPLNFPVPEIDTGVLYIHRNVVWGIEQ